MHFFVETFDCRFMTLDYNSLGIGLGLVPVGRFCLSIFSACRRGWLWPHNALLSWVILNGYILEMRSYSFLTVKLSSIIYLFCSSTTDYNLLLKSNSTLGRDLLLLVSYLWACSSTFLLFLLYIWYFYSMHRCYKNSLYHKDDKNEKVWLIKRSLFGNSRRNKPQILLFHRGNSQTIIFCPLLYTKLHKNFMLTKFFYCLSELLNFWLLFSFEKDLQIPFELVLKLGKIHAWV